MVPVYSEALFKLWVTSKTLNLPDDVNEIIMETEETKAKCLTTEQAFDVYKKDILSEFARLR
jgi:hypothetical protein